MKYKLILILTIFLQSDVQCTITSIKQVYLQAVTFVTSLLNNSLVIKRDNQEQAYWSVTYDSFAEPLKETTYLLCFLSALVTKASESLRDDIQPEHRDLFDRFRVWATPMNDAIHQAHREKNYSAIVQFLHTK